MAYNLIKEENIIKANNIPHAQELIQKGYNIVALPRTTLGDIFFNHIIETDGWINPSKNVFYLGNYRYFGTGEAIICKEGDIFSNMLNPHIKSGDIEVTPILLSSILKKKITNTHVVQLHYNYPLFYKKIKDNLNDNILKIIKDYYFVDIIDTCECNKCVFLCAICKNFGMDLMCECNDYDYPYSVEEYWADF